MFSRFLVIQVLIAAFIVVSAGLLLAAEGSGKGGETPPQYITQGFFMSKPYAVEGEVITFHIRAVGSGQTPSGKLTLKEASGRVVKSVSLDFNGKDNRYEFQSSWAPSKNGMYTAEVILTTDGYVLENTQAKSLQLLVPVIVKNRILHFPWYRTSNHLRWMTVCTSTGADQVMPLRERGIKALAWSYGGMTWVNEEWNREKSWEDLEKSFTEMYRNGLRQADYDGIGIDEFGGYTGTRQEQGTKMALNVLKDLRKDPENKKYVVAWLGGMLRPEIAQHFRESCDLLLQETYVFAAMQGWLQTENIYAMIDDRIMAGARGMDILVPTYGVGCTTIQCLDIVGIPAKMHTGEVEQVVRYMRRIVPEMRGLGFYNCVDFSEGSTPEKAEILERFGDEMCLKYFIKPVVTLMPNSMWIEKDSEGKDVVCVGVSNIGAMDSGPVKIRLYDNGKKSGTISADKIPAGPNGLVNRVVIKSRLRLKSGQHDLEAVIDSASGSTVLDGRIKTDWYIQPEIK